LTLFSRFSSPLREEDEDNCEDLWDAASLDYPGNQSPTGWEFLAEEDENDPLFYEEPRFHTWHYWLMGLTWGLALAIGVPAAMFTEHHPFVETENSRIGGHRKGRPGCYVPADPFKNPYSTTVNDPGFNFTLSNLIITYIFPVVILLFMIGMIYCKKITDNLKFRRYVKIFVFLTLIFIISRCAPTNNYTSGQKMVQQLQINFYLEKKDFFVTDSGHNFPTL
jgi:hypothetical protein